MVATPHDSAKWRRIADFQVNIARTWLEQYERSDEPVFKFVAAFSAFNAIYWTWSSIAASECGDRNTYGELKLPSERVQIDALIARISGEHAERLLDEEATVALLELFQRRDPLKDMRRRERSEEGDESSGAQEKRRLAEEGSAVKRLTALARLLYQVRCNLVHGSKAVQGSAADEELLRYTAPVVLRLAEVAVHHTRHYPP